MEFKIETLDPIITLGAFGLIPVYILNTPSWVNCNIMYVVMSKFVLLWYINTVCTHDVVSELETAVDLIGHINTLNKWRHVWDVVCSWAVTCNAIYMRKWKHQNLVSVTPPCCVFVEKILLKRTSFFCPSNGILSEVYLSPPTVY